MKETLQKISCTIIVLAFLLNFQNFELSFKNRLFLAILKLKLAIFSSKSYINQIEHTNITESLDF